MARERTEAERMKIAEWLHKRRPQMCWTELALWALGYKEWDDIMWGTCSDAQRIADEDGEWSVCWCMAQCALPVLNNRWPAPGIPSVIEIEA